MAADETIGALAATGDWRKAFDLVATLPQRRRPYAYITVAAESREAEVFGLIEKLMRDDPANYSRDSMANGLVRALVLSGYLPVADVLINEATSDYDKDGRLTFAASTLAETGKGSEALQYAALIGDSNRRAWALWEVASKMPLRAEWLFTPTLELPVYGSELNRRRSSRSLVGLPINLVAFAFPDRDHHNEQNLVANFVDESIADAAKLDLVSVSTAMQLGRRDARVGEALFQFPFELLASVVVELPPLLQSRVKKPELIGHPAKP